MDKKYLVVNRGSASEKYAVYAKGERSAFLHLEKSEIGCDYVCTLYLADKKEKKCITKKEFENSLDYALNVFFANKIIIGSDLKEAKKEIAGIGIRVVAPGKAFQSNKIIDSAYEKEIKKVIHDAPLHLLPTYEMIQVLKKVFKNIPIVGVSDSTFHSGTPDKAKYYAIPFADTKKYGIERYGYHGISIESVLNKLKAEARLNDEVGQGPVPEKLIICHIGSGVSLTAIKNGRGIENSMGFTPLEGAVMATRAGDIDSGVVALLADKLWLSTKKTKEYLNKKCGLLGVSGVSSDVRDLIKLEKEGNTQAKLALDMYVYRLQKYIGAYFVALGGLDAIVFTGTVGERSFIMRERICQDLSVLGIKINPEINNQSEGVDVLISTPDSPVKVLVRNTDEIGQIARSTVSVLS